MVKNSKKQQSYITTFLEIFQVRKTRMSKLFLLAILLHLFYNMITGRFL